MNQNITNEFSFILKPSKHGIGVFAVHDISKKTKLALFPDNHASRMVSKDALPDVFRGYCIDKRGNKLACPQKFNHMSIGWYLNHSTNPNAEHKDYVYYSIRDIVASEEILIDYNTLEEPEGSREDYYKNE